MPEVKLGIPSVIEAALLPMLVGWGARAQIMLLGETFAAHEALQWGLVERVVPAAALDGAIEAWIGKLLTSKPPRGAAAKATDPAMGGPAAVRPPSQAGIEAFARAYETDEPAVAMREFLATQKARNKTG